VWKARGQSGTRTRFSTTYTLLGLFPHNKVVEVRDRTDIVTLIGETVQLRRAGTNYVGLCPFHQEKTPSFHVSPSKQFFYCFGCQKSGDVFRFLMDREGRSFTDVVRDLASRAGVEIAEEDATRPEKKALRIQQESDRQRLLKLNALAARYFETQFSSHPQAVAYLSERKIGEHTRKAFRLGYAPDSWDGLLHLFRQHGVPHELAEQGGLLIRRDGTAPLPAFAPPTPQTHYDRFRDRLMCPLLLPQAGRDKECAVIAFSGRLLPTNQPRTNEGAKYINSPETPLYRKGENLYGLHVARDAIRQKRQAILVEGNFDVLSLYEHGFANTLAPWGTALSETQVRLLSRLLGDDGHVVLMLDGDKAGRAATLKDISLLFSSAQWADVATLQRKNLEVRVVKLPEGADPDTLAHENPELFLRLLGQARPAIDYVLDEHLEGMETGDLAARAKILGKIAPLVASLSNDTLRELYVGRLATALAVEPVVLWRQIERSSSAPPATPAPSATPPQKTAPGNSSSSGPKPPSERREDATASLDGNLRNLLSLLAGHPDLWDMLTDEILAVVGHPALAELLREVRELCHSGEVVSVETALEMCPVELRAPVADAMLRGRFSTTENPVSQLARLSVELRAQSIQREVLDLTRKLKRDSRSTSPDDRFHLLRRIQELSKMRETLLHEGPVVQTSAASTAQGDPPR